MGTLWLGLLALMQFGLLMTFPLRPPGQPVRGPSETELEFAEAYLKNFYGYKFKPERQRRAAECGEAPSAELKDKVREMQHFFGLRESGELTGQTLAAMRKPRCGLSDVEKFGKTVRWTNKTLSYRISRYSPVIRSSRVRRTFREAWNIWAEVITIRFRRRNKRAADINICFRGGDHEDGSPFDGEGGILAHAFLPGDGIGGDVHFDVDEDWTRNATGFSLFAVAVHEFGHALGLPHSSDPGAIMYPVYNFVPQNEFQLSFQDVKDVQDMYGINPSFSSMFLKRPPPRTPNKCDPDLSFDAVTELQQEIIFFKDRFLWRRHPQFEETRTTLITSLWSDIPPHIDAAYQNVEMNKMLFFKGSQYWAVQNTDILQGYPRNISDFGFPPRVQSIDAALHFRAARLTVFFTGHECWRYDEAQGRMENGSPEPTAQQWPGVHTPLDAVISYEGFVYFFKGNVQYKYDPQLKYIIRTGPANELLDCKGQLHSDWLKRGKIQ